LNACYLLGWIYLINIKNLCYFTDLYVMNACYSSSLVTCIIACLNLHGFLVILIIWNHGKCQQIFYLFIINFVSDDILFILYIFRWYPSHLHGLMLHAPSFLKVCHSSEMTIFLMILISLVCFTHGCIQHGAAHNVLDHAFILTSCSYLHFRCFISTINLFYFNFLQVR